MPNLRKRDLRSMRSCARFLAHNHHLQNHAAFGRSWKSCTSPACVLARQLDLTFTIAISTPGRLVVVDEITPEQDELKRQDVFTDPPPNVLGAHTFSSLSDDERDDLEVQTGKSAAYWLLEHDPELPLEQIA